MADGLGDERRFGDENGAIGSQRIGHAIPNLPQCAIQNGVVGEGDVARIRGAVAEDGRAAQRGQMQAVAGGARGGVYADGVAEGKAGDVGGDGHGGGGGGGKGNGEGGVGGRPCGRVHCRFGDEDGVGDGQRGVGSQQVQIIIQKQAKLGGQGVFGQRHCACVGDGVAVGHFPARVGQGDGLLGATGGGVCAHRLGEGDGRLPQLFSSRPRREGGYAALFDKVRINRATGALPQPAGAARVAAQAALKGGGERGGHN